jgi:hypothetical protein
MKAHYKKAALRVGLVGLAGLVSAGLLDNEAAQAVARHLGNSLGNSL